MTTKQRVESILKYSRLARNSDIELLLIFMQKSGMNLTDKQIELFKNIPTPETITRHRRLIQEKGNYLPDPEVDENRYRKFKYIKQNIKSDDSDKLLEKRVKEIWEI